MRTKRALSFGIGAALLVAAAAAVPTPVPGLGLLLFAASLYFLARGSKSALRWVKWSRRRMPRMSRGLDRMKPGLPPPMRRFIEQSGPGE